MVAALGPGGSRGWGGVSRERDSGSWLPGRLPWGPTHTRGSKRGVEIRGYEARPGGQSSDFDLKVNGERLKINNVNEKGQSK